MKVSYEKLVEQQPVRKFYNIRLMSLYIYDNTQQIQMQ